MRVYVSVCDDILRTTQMRDLYHIFVHVAYGRGLVLRQGQEIPREILGFLLN